ncbi:MAG: HEAT repeat domain-containing protein [Anaerolineae bacterium]|jgi:HEAT repeat protein|nr:HEAT repeat domain-containing protein [Anaerolineae bacterium]MDH7473024.1 HEAT repeat domain-containing protein [Anaerolineae bacterium]
MVRKGGLTKQEKITFLKDVVGAGDLTTDYLPVLLKYLDDEDAEVRALAVENLWDYPDRDLVDVLIDKAEHDPDLGVRCKAIITLGRFIYEGDMADYDFDWGEMESIMREDELPQEDFFRVRDFLFSVYYDQARSLDERRYAVEALGFHTNDRVFSIIEEAYAHPDPKMKMSAIFAMGRSGNDRWTDIILNELDSPQKELQMEAIRAAGEMGLDEAGKQLWRLTYSEDRDVKLEAIWALGQTGWEGAFERLDELTIMGEDEEVREVAEDALEEWYLFSGLMDETLLEDEEFEEDFMDEGLEEDFADEDFEQFEDED